MKKCLIWLNDNLEEFILLVLLAVISVVMMTQVFLRYIFSSPITWAEELCRYCFVFTGVFSAGYCIRKKAGIRVDVIINFLPKFMQVFLDYAGQVLMLALYAYLFYSSFSLISSTTSVSPAMQLPVKYVYMAFPIGFGLGVIRVIQDIILYTKSLKAGGNTTC